MAVDSSPRGRGSGLAGRRVECRVLDRLLEAVRAGDSRVLVVHGEPGVGKSALLEYLAGRAGGFGVLRVAGVQSEMELAFAGLHQLVAPMLDGVERLPAPQLGGTSPRTCGHRVRTTPCRRRRQRRWCRCPPSGRPAGRDRSHGLPPDPHAR